MKASNGTTAELGLREQNKFDKRQRIRVAGSELFSKRGYDATTLREIAKRAHVGLGTLFNYAQDKSDLIFLIFNPELEKTMEEALRSVRMDRPLIDNLIAVFQPHYRRFGSQVVLSRILLKELVFYSEGKQASAFQSIRGRLLSGIAHLVREAQRRGEIRAGVDAELVARHFFFTFSAAIRWWIAKPTPNPRAGIADLRRLLELQLTGLTHLGGRAGRRYGDRPRRPESASGRSNNIPRGAVKLMAIEQS